MLREVLRSTLYSSSRPFSSSATRRSSFSTLIINLLPVFGEPKPKIRFTLSIIIGERVCDHERSVATFWSALGFDQELFICAPADVLEVASVLALASASGGRQKVVQKSSASGAEASRPEWRALPSYRRRGPRHPLRVPHRAPGPSRRAGNRCFARRLGWFRRLPVRL